MSDSLTISEKLELFYQSEEKLLEIAREFGASEVALLTKDGRRNVKIALFLKEQFGIDIVLSQEEHGPDAYMIAGPHHIPVELKSCYSKKRFEFHCNSGNISSTLYGLINRVHIYAEFNRPNGRGVDTIKEIAICWPGSYYHQKLTRYREEILAGGVPKRQSVSMLQIKRGADRAPPKLKLKHGGSMTCLKAGTLPSVSMIPTPTTT